MKQPHLDKTPFMFVISPTKTMRETSKLGIDPPIYKQQTESILTYLRQFDETSLQDFLQVNPKLAQLNYQRLHTSSANAMAIDAYHGAQFKALDPETLSEKARHYLQNKLRILSGLYGLLKPFDRIRLYRLPMAHQIDEVKLSDFWRPIISVALEPYALVNLASLEYAAAIDMSRIKVLEIRFQKKQLGKLKTHAMDAKRLRGLMVRYAAENTLENLHALQNFQADGYTFDAEASTDHLWIFSK